MNLFPAARPRMGGALVLAALVALATLFPGAVAHPAPGGDPVRPDATRVRELALGTFDAPAPAARRLHAQPRDVPLADELETTRVRRVLRLRRDGLVPFSAVALSWRAEPVGALSAAVRTRAPGSGSWSRWITVDSEESGAREERGGTQVVYTGGAGAVEVVLSLADGAAPRDVRAHLIDPGDTAPARPRSEPRAGGGGGPTLASTPSVVMPVHTRAQWGADESKMTWAPEYAARVDAVTVHHTAGTNNYSAADVPAILRSIYHFQAVTRGWGDIGYHLLVDRFGRAWEGRRGGLDTTVIGAHAGGFNSGTGGVAIMGDFTGTDPTADSLETTARFIAFKLWRHGADPRGTTRLTGGPNTKYSTRVTITVPRVFGHNLTSATACPGGRLDTRLDQLRARASELRGQVVRAPAV